MSRLYIALRLLPFLGPLLIERDLCPENIGLELSGEYTSPEQLVNERRPVLL